MLPNFNLIHSLYSRPSQYRLSWDWVRGSIISKKPYLGPEMGGGMWREAVLGGAILGGTTVLFKL